MVVPVCAASLSALVGMGFLGLIKDELRSAGDGDPVHHHRARAVALGAVRESLSARDRARQELLRAAFTCATSLFKPGTLAIVTDIVGIPLIYLAPIPLLQKLALMGTVWLTSIFLSGMVLCPLMLSFLPRPEQKKRKNPSLARTR